MILNYDLKKLYLDALAPQAGETVTFINDFPGNKADVTEGHEHRREMTRIWHGVMETLAAPLNITVNPIVTIDLKNPAPGEFDAQATVNGKAADINKIMDGWGEKDIIVAITGPSITGELVRRLPQNFRFASAPNVRVDFEGFRDDYSRIPLRFQELTHKMGRAFYVDMSFLLDDEKWFCRLDVRGQRFQFNENGQAHRPGEFINLPSGCANIPPYPGIKGDPRGDSRTAGEIPALIDGELVVYRIKENRIVDIMGDDDAAAQERAHILESGSPEMAVVTKLGLGVNRESRCNGTHVGDEKTMGMHWGYGPKKHFPDTIWMEHPIHMDIDFVYMDGSREPIIRNNFYAPNLGDLF